MNKKNLPSVRKKYGGANEGEWDSIALAVMQGRTDDLDEDHKRMLNLTRDAYLLICDTVNKGVAVKKMRELHPEFSERTALTYINQGIRIWNPFDRLERDFLNSVFVTEILKEIKDPNCNATNKAKNLATLQRYLADMPTDPMDPSLMEKHNINIQLNINGNNITVPAEKWDAIKQNKIIASALEQEIDEAQAVEIMEG